jgi:hypothetical protein
MIEIPNPIQRPLFINLATPEDFVVTEGVGTCEYASESFEYTPSFNGLKIIKNNHNTTNLTFNFGLKTLITNENGYACITFKGRMPESPENSLELIIYENGLPIITNPFQLVGGVFNLMMKDFEASNLNSYNFAIRILQGTTALTTTSLLIDEIQAYYSYNNNFDFNYRKGGNPTLWADRTDLVNTQNLTALTDNVVQITTATEGNGFDFASLFDTNAKVTPINVNDVVSVDFSCEIETPSGTDRFIDVKGLVDGVAYRQVTHKLLKGAGNIDQLSISWILPVKEAFKLNGLQIALNPNSACTISNRYISVTRIHEAL